MGLNVYDFYASSQKYDLSTYNFEIQCPLEISTVCNFTVSVIASVDSFSVSTYKLLSAALNFTLMGNEVLVIHGLVL